MIKCDHCSKYKFSFQIEFQTVVDGCMDWLWYVAVCKKCCKELQVSNYLEYRDKKKQMKMETVKDRPKGCFV